MVSGGLFFGSSFPELGRGGVDSVVCLSLLGDVGVSSIRGSVGDFASARR